MLPRLVELLPLDDLPRTGWILAGIGQPESVAGHTLGVALVALALVERVEPALDAARVLAMSLVHDLSEAASGDLPKRASRLLPEGAKAELERRLGEQLVEPLSHRAAAAWREYRSRETREARFTADCDALALGVRLVGYRRAGHACPGDFDSAVRASERSEFAPVRALGAEILAALGVE